MILMGIVNVTPDSFFSGGRFTDPKAAVDHAGHIMEVTGTESSQAGFKALYVTGFLKK